MLRNLNSVGFIRYKKPMGSLLEKYHYSMIFFPCTFTILKVPRKGNEWRDAPSKSTYVGSLISDCIHALHFTLSKEKLKFHYERHTSAGAFATANPSSPKMAETNPLIYVAG